MKHMQQHVRLGTSGQLLEGQQQLLLQQHRAAVVQGRLHQVRISKQRVYLGFTL